MDAPLVLEVKQRASGICEYCRIPQAFYPAPFQADHVIARQHGGKTVLSNLAWSCLSCNSHKGPNVASVESPYPKLVRLFNPRRPKWHWHFRWEGTLLVGRTPIGKATVSILNMNNEFLLGLRQELFDEGRFPFEDC